MSQGAENGLSATLIKDILKRVARVGAQVLVRFLCDEAMEVRADAVPVLVRKVKSYGRVERADRESEMGTIEVLCNGGDAS